MKTLVKRSSAMGLILPLLYLGCAGPAGDGKFGDASLDEKAVATSSGLKYVDLKVGAGPEAKVGDTVEVHCTGWLRNGKKFYSTFDSDKPLSFKIGTGQVIKGWDEGVPGMKEGGKRKLLIPSDLAYGTAGKGQTIPPNAELVFDIELLLIRKKAN